MPGPASSVHLRMCVGLSRLLLQMALFSWCGGRGSERDRPPGWGGSRVTLWRGGPLTPPRDPGRGEPLGKSCSDSRRSEGPCCCGGGCDASGQQGSVGCGRPSFSSWAACSRPRAFPVSPPSLRGGKSPHPLIDFPCEVPLPALWHPLPFRPCPLDGPQQGELPAVSFLPAQNPRTSWAWLAKAQGCREGPVLWSPCLLGPRVLPLPSRVGRGAGPAALHPIRHSPFDPLPLMSRGWIEPPSNSAVGPG